MLGQPQCNLILRTVEPDTAQWLERLLGRSQKQRTTESQQMGADSQRDGVGLQRQLVTDAVVLASEIQTLSDLTGYLKLVGEPIRKIKYQWKNNAPERNTHGEIKGFVQRKKIPEPKAPAWLKREKEEKQDEEKNVGMELKSEEMELSRQRTKDTEEEESIIIKHNHGRLKYSR